MQNSLIKLRPNRLDSYLPDYFFRKTIRQKVARQVRVNSAGLEIKQLVFVDLPDRGAVSALNIVGKDLELRFSIHTGFRRQQQILVSLHRVSLLRPVTHKDLAVKDGPRIAIQYSLVELAAGTVWLFMIDHGMRVRMLPGTYKI